MIVANDCREKTIPVMARHSTGCHRIAGIIVLAI